MDEVDGVKVVGAGGTVAVPEGTEEVPSLPKVQGVTDSQYAPPASSAVITNVQISLVVIERIAALLSWK